MQALNIDFGQTATTIKSISSGFADIWEKIAEINKDYFDNLKNYWKGHNYNLLGKEWNKIQQDLYTIIESAKNENCNVLYQAINVWATNEEYDLGNWHAELHNQMSEPVLIEDQTDTSSLVFDYDNVDKIRDTIDQKFGSIVAQDIPSLEKTIGGLTGYWQGDDAEKALEEMQNIAGTIETRLGAIQTAMNLAISTSHAGNILDDFGDSVATVAKYTVDAAGKALEKGVDAVKTAVDNTTTVMKASWNNLIQGAESLIDKLKFDE